MDRRIAPKPSSNEQSRQRSDYAHAGVLKIAAAMSVELSEATQAVYVESLIRLTSEAFDAAVSRTIREWDRPHMMPPLAFILARIPENRKVGAEAAWELLQKIVYRDWHPDIGWTREVDLDAQMEFAIRQVGGLRRIHDCEEKNFSFLRRDFLEAWSRFAEEGGEQLRLSTKQAEQILGPMFKQLGEARKQLPEPRKPEGFAHIAAPARPASRVIRQLTEEEHKARLAELRRQAEQLQGGAI